MKIIHDRVSGKDKNIEDLDGSNIKSDTVIHDNYDTFKAHIMVFGNKQYLWKLFGYKQKETSTQLSDGIKEHCKNLKSEEAKTIISVDSDLSTAVKRQKRSPAGKPKGI